MTDKPRRINFHPADWLAGTAGILNASEVGVYWTICTLIYDRGGPIPDDRKWLRRVLADTHHHTLNAAIRRLIELDKIQATDGLLSVKRCSRELQEAGYRIARARLDGLKGGRPPKENKGLAKGSGFGDEKPTSNLQPLTSIDSPPSLRETPPPSTAPPDGDAMTKAKPNGQSRGSRLPADWQPTPEDCDFAERFGLDPGEVADSFADFWHAKPGQGGVKLDWSATWRNWCRRETPGKAGSPRREYGLTGAAIRVARAFRERQHRMADDEGE